MIIVFKHAKGLENEEVENFINWELIKNFHFYTFIIYNFGIYDEQNDSLMYFQAIQESFLTRSYTKYLVYSYILSCQYSFGF